jgi:small multidrug resistance pump
MSLSSYTFLLLATIFEVLGTAALGASHHFTRLGPSALVIACFVASLVFASFPYKVIPMGIVYSVWSGLGTVMVVAVGWTVFGQRLDLPTLLGIALILAGVLVINLAPVSLPAQ